MRDAQRWDPGGSVGSPLTALTLLHQHCHKAEREVATQREREREREGERERERERERGGGGKLFNNFQFERLLSKACD